MNFFVKESYGVIWNFYHNSHGICYCKMTDDNITEYNVLIPDGQEDFDVAIDDSDCIHMVYQNKDGDILYVNHFENTWRKTVLMKSKSKRAYPKNFVIRVGDDGLYILYCLEYNTRKMLVHHVVNGEYEEPFVVDCIKNEFCTDCDIEKNPVVFYYSMAEKSWGIKKYMHNEKKWGDFQNIEIPSDIKNPFLYIDTEGNEHIVYENDMSILEYFRGEEKVVGTGRKPVMFFQNEDIITWESVVDNKVYIRKQNDKSPTVIMTGGFSSPREFGIRYTCYESLLKVRCCKGNIINGNVRLYGVNNFFAISKAPPSLACENKTSDVERYIDFKKMKIKINQLEGVIEKLQRRIEEYDNVKINRRLQDLETAVKNKI